MKRCYLILLPVLCLSAAPALAQTTIGGGTCSSSSLNGTYELLLSGRQLTPSGTITRLFQGVGTASFDGLSKVVFTLTANTVTITSGDIATFTLEAYSQISAASPAGSFAVVGSDAAYAYTGTGSAQPAT